MKIAEILAKIAKNEALTDEEKKFVSAYKEPEGGDTKISELTRQLTELTTERDALKKAQEDAANAGLSELERIKNEKQTLETKVATLTNDLTAAKTQAAKQAFEAASAELAGKHKCTDVSYLRYKLSEAGIDFKDAAKAETFVSDLKKLSPNLFAAEANQGGAGTPPAGAPPAAGGADSKRARLAEIMKKDAPSGAERVEAMTLAEEIKAMDAETPAENA